MKILRTPDECFDGLPDFNFTPHYTTIAGRDGVSLRFHFIDEGPRDADPILLMHGNPSWSYLHRHMIAGLVSLGHRVISLDLMGLGRSDKPNDPSYYTLARHTEYGEKWLRPCIQVVPRFYVLRDSWVVWLHGDEAWKNLRTCLVGTVWIRRVIRGHFLSAERASRSSVH